VMERVEMGVNWLIGNGRAHPYEEVAYEVYRLEDF